MQDRRFRNLENVERVKILSSDERPISIRISTNSSFVCPPSPSSPRVWTESTAGKKLVGASNSRSSFRLDESRRNVDSPAKLPRVQFAETARAKNRSISIGVDAE